MFDLTGKAALVTGGGSGLGRVTAKRLARAGAAVSLIDLADTAVLADSLGGIAIQADVSDDDAMARAMAAIAAHHARIDIAVNNAGVALDDHSDITTIDDDMHRTTWEVNALGVAHGMKHAVPHMTDGGSIINMASLAGVWGFPDFPSYHMAKAAVVGLTKSTALQLAPRRIRVNAVCPGFVDSPMAREGDTDYGDFVARGVPLGRLGHPEEVAATIHFLASDDSAFITGQAINICGGLSTGMAPAVAEWATGSSGSE